MKLVVDVGNTATKCALFQEGSISQKWQFLNTEEPVFLASADVGQVQAYILSASGEVSSELSLMLKPIAKGFSLGFDLNLPFTSKYTTPETLGKDRMAGIAGAINQFPSQACLIIDAGTCITFDVVDGQAVHWGGRISPGLKMRSKAMNQFTARLPEVDVKPDYSKNWGLSTQESLQSGIISGVRAEIDQAIDNFNNQFPSGRVIITGGDTKFFENHLKNNIFADPDLVIKGLHAILCLNEDS